MTEYKSVPESDPKRLEEEEGEEVPEWQPWKKLLGANYRFLIIILAPIVLSPMAIASPDSVSARWGLDKNVVVALECILICFVYHLLIIGKKQNNNINKEIKKQILKKFCHSDFAYVCHPCTGLTCITSIHVLYIAIYIRDSKLVQ